MLAVHSSPATVSRTRPQVPLLPQEAEGTPLKETSATKSTGKKDKDGKGGVKKGQESKGGKGSKGDPSGEPSSGGLGHTAWPPCMALSSLVDVIATGNMSQVQAEHDVLIAFLGLWSTRKGFFKV